MYTCIYFDIVIGIGSRTTMMIQKVHYGNYIFMIWFWLILNNIKINAEDWQTVIPILTSSLFLLLLVINLIAITLHIIIIFNAIYDIIY